MALLLLQPSRSSFLAQTPGSKLKSVIIRAVTEHPCIRLSVLVRSASTSANVGQESHQLKATAR